MSVEISPNAMIDIFILEDRIGRGGMGDIWRALNTQTQTQVALKVLKPELRESTQAKERFRREAELTQQLNSPYVIQVQKYGITEAKVPYMVMELLEGEDLQTILDRQGPLPPIQALEIVIDVLKALSEAHQLNIIHRDLKPANLFLIHKAEATHNYVKILDFGLATQRTHNSSSSRDIALEGSYLYMPPEQAKREAMSATSDIYSIGATLFALLTGRPPRVPTGGDKSFDHFEQTVPKLSETRPSLRLPSKLDPIIQRCLSIDSNQRPESADILRRALEQIAHNLKRTAHSPEDDFSLAPAQQSTSTLGLSSLDRDGSRQDDFSTESRGNLAQLDKESIDLATILQRNAQEIIERWTLSITERPEQTRVQAHRLKSEVKSCLAWIEGIAVGRPTHNLQSNLEQLSQVSFTHPPLELLPLITLSLFRRAVIEELRLNPTISSSSQLVQTISTQLDEVIFHLRQAFLQVIATKRHDETNNSLYRLFSSGAGTPLLCTTAGVAINTHPKLRAALTGEEHTGLTGRKLFDILRGFQPIHSLYEELRLIEQAPPRKAHLLKNESAAGRAEELVVYPHLVGKGNQSNILVMIDVVSERTMTSFIPSLEEMDFDFASPQALPWLMTSEVQALKPEDIEISSAIHQANRSVNDRFGTSDSLRSLNVSSGSPQQRSPLNQPRGDRPQIRSSGVWENFQKEAIESAKPQSSISTPYQQARSSEPKNYGYGDRESISPQRFQRRSPSDEAQEHFTPSSLPHHRDYSPSSSEYRSHRPSSSSEMLGESQEIAFPLPPEKSPQPHRALHHSAPLMKMGQNSYYETGEEVEWHYHDEELISPEYVLNNPTRSTPPRAPDTEEYIAQHLSQPPLSTHHMSRSGESAPREEAQFEHRDEVDSSAPTDPPPPSDPVPNTGLRSEYNQSIPPLFSHTSTSSSYSSRAMPHLVSLDPHQDVQSPPDTLSRNLPPRTDEASTSRVPPPAISAKKANVAQNRRPPLERPSSRISSVTPSVGSTNIWLFNTLVFIIFTLALFYLRRPISDWLNNQNNEQITSTEATNKRLISPPDVKAGSTSLTDEQRASSAADGFTTIKVNVPKASFVAVPSNDVICKDFAFCAVPTTSEIVVSSRGYYDFPLSLKALREGAGATLQIELQPKPQELNQ